VHDLKTYMTAKKSGNIVRTRKSVAVKPNGRSADFIMPGFATGCDLACTYCYVSRHRAFGNPLEQLSNWDTIWESTKKHYISLGPKVSNQCDPDRWTYDIGESTDCVTPRNREATIWFIKKFLTETEAKPTFATKVADTSDLLPPLMRAYKGRSRVRVSLMPQSLSSRLEPATSPIQKRIESINNLVQKNYEVHINFSPVVLHTNWVQNYIDLLKLLDNALCREAKQQLKAEVIFLTHHPALHEKNLLWAPEAESLLWQPELQEIKTTQRGDGSTLRYKALTVKAHSIKLFKAMLQQYLPSCEIRYIF